MRKHTFILVIAALLVSAGMAGSAEAQFSRHERVELAPIKKGGEVVGVRLKATLRAEGQHGVVRVGLGPNSMTGTESFSTNGSGRSMASDPAQGYLLHQWPEMKVEAGKPLEIKLEVLFKDAPNLKPGQQVEIIAAFNNEAKSDYWHVYGLQKLGGTAESLKKVPELTQPAAQRKAKIDSIKRSGRSATRRQPASKRSPKKPAKARAARPTRARAR